MARPCAETNAACGVHRISDSLLSWPLHDARASRAAEAAALGQHPPHTLMARAGLAVARLSQAVAPHASRIQVWAGPGNNGGDGLVAARWLHQAGRRVQVSLLGDASRLPPDAARALHEAQAAGVAITAWSGLVTPADLHVDALLGLGANRAPSGAIADGIRALQTSSGLVLAVDLPSGLHADTGMPLGDAAVRATHTLALLSLKPGCHTGRGRDHAGTVWLDHLGVDAGSPSAWLVGATQRPGRLHASHKGSFGDVAVVGGAPGMVGAAWLAARAALSAGAGRVYACLLDEDAARWDSQRPELMVRPQWWHSAPATLAATTVVCGCGGGDRVREVLPALLTHAGRLVLDADALNVMASDPSLAAGLQRRSNRGLATLLTPHPLEAARWLGITTADVQHDRLAAAQRLAALCTATVLLKGSGTVIASPGQVPCINPTGGAALATAGTGDVLAGWAAGIWAQDPDRPAMQVATAAAWLHGQAAATPTAAAQGAPRVRLADDLIRAMAALVDEAQAGSPSSPPG
ncbi:MAG: NAD(P)H-hydrate dehydratase [Rubrivivax sp.]|nr:NAD(P)H-hydrate dehydratase [Rubrivivax sp.]